MTDIDTSSYPKPPALPAQQSLLSQVGQYQQLESNSIGIDQSKLKLMNDRYHILNGELSTLISKPNVTPQDIINSSQQLVKLGIIPPDMHAKFITQIPTNAQVQQNPDAIKNFLQQTLTRNMSTQEAVNFHYGVPGTFDNGQQITPIVQSPKFGMRATGAPIQQQLPPGTQVTTPGGTQLLGPQTPVTPGPGINASPQPNRLPIQADAPIRPITVKTVPGQIVGAPGATPGPQAQNAGSQIPSGPMTSQAPLFENGRNALAEDQTLATNKLTAIKPALQALPLIKQLPLSGPGTQKITEIAAGLKNFGIIPTGTNANDKTAITQEVMKKLAQYVGQNPIGQRSDAAQTLAEAGSPNPKVQILPALLNLTRDAIILDRVQAARAGAFIDDKGNQRNDLQNYGQFRSTFPASIDERAFGLDLMEPKDRNALLDEMVKKQNTFEGKKFWRSMAIVKKQGLIDTGK